MRDGSASGKPVALASEWVLPGGNASGDDDATLCSVLTLAIWFGCGVVGMLGLALPYAHPMAPAVEHPAVRAEFLEVQLVNDSQSIPMAALLSPASASFKPPMPPSLPIAVSIPKPPPLTAVASPSVAFALPADTPTKAPAPIEAAQDENIKPDSRVNSESAKLSGQAVNSANNQSENPVSRSETSQAPVLPPSQTLTFGLGEGRQVAPTYPPLAVRAGQEGAVRIRFQVDEAGNVLKVEMAEPSPWPLLNEAALRTVSQRWRFAPGARRLYEVPIHFRLTK